MKLLLKIVLRNLKNRPVNYIINLLGLSISFSLIFILGTYCYRELTADAYHNNTNQKFLLYNSLEQDKYGAILPGVLKEQIDLNIPAVKESLRLRQTWRPPIFKVEGREPIISELIYADKDFFDFFSYKVVSGSLKDALTNPMSLVLLKSEAVKLFGTADAYGKTVLLNNTYSFTVTAVIENPKAKSFLSIKAITPTSSINNVKYDNSQDDFTNWGQRNFLIFVKLNKNTISENAADLITNLFPSERKEHTDIRLCSLPDIYMNQCGLNSPFLSFINKGNKTQITILSMVAVLILLISLVNYINISSSQRNGLIKQTGIQKIIGANRSHISLGILIESQLIFLSAVLLAFLFSISIAPMIQNYTDLIFGTELLLSPIVILGILLAISLLSLLISISPSIRHYEILSINKFNKATVSSKEKSSMQRAFVIFQFAAAIVLITFTILVQKQIRFGSSNLGFNEENVLAMKLNEQLLNKVDVLKGQLSKQLEVIQVSLARFYPGDVGINVQSGKITQINGEEKYKTISYMDVDAQFFSIMGIQPVGGSFFTEDLSNSPDKIVVNETFVKENELKEPIGTKVFFGNKEHEIIGVAKDFHLYPVSKPITPLVFLNQKPTHLFFPAYCLIKFHSAGFSSLNQTIEGIKKIGKELSPGFPFEVKFIDQGVEAMYKSETQFRKTFSFFSGLAIFISCLGIFALSLADSQRRIKEIGIRKVNGAKISEILTMLNKDLVKWVVIAFVIATPVAYYIMNKWLENFAYKTTLSWWIFALAGLLALGIALLTVSWQSWRAATRNPVEALRYE